MSGEPTICSLLLVCRFFLEIENSQEIGRKIFHDKLTNIRSSYQPNFFPKPAPQQNISEHLEKDSLHSNFYPFINYVQLPELKLRREDKYEQPGNGMNGFIFTKTT